MKRTPLAIAIMSSMVATSTFATNGMNMEGYGPISTAMGGTAQAYNNGLGGMMNNPATLGMGAESGNKFQFAIGGLNSNVSSSAPNGSGGTVKTDSNGTFIMPNFGYARKRDKLTFGFGIMSQGGMGTDYGKAGNGDLFQGATDMQNNATALSGKNIRSEVGVGRVILPIGYDITPELTLAASLDYVWGGMDLQMDMSGSAFRDLAYTNPGTAQQAPTGNVTGTMFSGMNTYFNNAQGPTVPNLTNVRYARFDFSDGSPFTQATTGAGFAGKLGFVYKLNNKLSIGGSYHSQTAMSDFEGDASVTMAVDGDFGSGAFTNEPIEVKGKIKVLDFQWPETLAIGVNYQASEKWMVSADIKRIGWSSVMDKLQMSFKADTTQTGLAQGFAGADMNVSMEQNWDDQTVVMLGGQYQLKKNIAVRGGYNYASNPVPDDTLNPLFPAIIESHYTFGAGYGINKNHLVDASLTLAPEVKATNSENDITSKHSQTNWQLMYTYKWQ